MRILVKTNKGLRNLGEGKIYSKGQLRLNEFTDSSSTGVTAVANPDGQDFKSNAEMYRNINNNFKNPAVTAVEFQANDTVNGKNVAPNKELDDVVTTVSRDNMNKIPQLSKYGTIKVVNNRKGMTEMRKNSIPFTKKELYKFLKEI